MRAGFLPRLQRETRMREAGEIEQEPTEGLEGLYRRYAHWLGERLGRRVDAADAADLVQETYLRIAPTDTGDIRHPKAFLLRVAMNLLRDRVRRDAKRCRAQDHAPHDASSAEQPEALLLKQIIASMPPLYRDVFVLSRFRGMTYNQIAILRDVSVKTVEWRMARALEHCARRLDE